MKVNLDYQTMQIKVLVKETRNETMKQAFCTLQSKRRLLKVGMQRQSVARDLCQFI